MALFIADVCYGLRTLKRSSGFAAGAIAVLALGVGANISIFTVARGLVFQSLPFAEPERLVGVWKQRVQTGARQGASWPDLSDWATQQHVFRGVAAYINSTAYAAGTNASGGAEPVATIRVTEGFFSVLGIQPAMGRLFSLDEFREETETPMESPAVVSHAYWVRRLGGRRDVLGQLVPFGSERHVVIGVLPRDFRMFRSSAPEVFSPLRAFPGHSVDRRMAYLTVIARLSEGVTISRARAEMSAYSRRAAGEHPETESGLRCELEGLHEHWFGPQRPVMLVLLGTVAMVLLIACANVAFLFLVRATRRESETAMRIALGAGKGRVFSQLMAEPLLVAVAGGAAGWVAALWCRDALAAFSAAAGMGLPRMEFDGEVIGFAVLVTAGTTAAFGIVPAWLAIRSGMRRGLMAACGTARGSSAQRFGRVAMIAEIGVSTLLVAGAATLLRGFVRMTSSHPGFEAEQTVTLSIGQVPAAGRLRERDEHFWSELLEKAGSLAGVQAAAICRVLPLSEEIPPARMMTRISAEDRPGSPGDDVTAEFDDVSAGYFRAMGIPLLGGRTFDARDALEKDRNQYKPVAVINQRLARELWGMEDPIGRRFVSGQRIYTVIGVAADVKQHRLWRATPEDVIYRPLWLADIFKSPTHSLVVRTSGDGVATAGVLKGVVRSIDAERPITAVRSMDDVIFQNTAWERLRAAVVTVFGAAALLLTVTGIFAVVSYSVALRRREIGIRIAVGGSPAHILGSVLRQGAWAAMLGVSSGGAAAWVLSRMLAARLRGVDPVDVATVAGVAAILAGAAVVACYVPARKATRIDPMAALKGE